MLVAIICKLSKSHTSGPWFLHLPLLRRSVISPMCTTLSGGWLVELLLEVIEMVAKVNPVGFIKFYMRSIQSLCILVIYGIEALSPMILFKGVSDSLLRNRI